MRRRHTPPQLPARRRAPPPGHQHRTIHRWVAHQRRRRPLAARASWPPRSMATSAACRPPSAAAHPSLRAAHARARVASTWRRRADPPTTGLAWPIVGHRRVPRGQPPRATAAATTSERTRRPPSAGAQPSLRAAHARATATACRHRRRPEPAVCSRHHLHHGRVCILHKYTPAHRAVLTKAHRGQGNDARHILARICAAICSQRTSDCPPLHAASRHPRRRVLQYVHVCTRVRTYVRTI